MALKPIETAVPAAQPAPKPAAVSAAKLAANRRNARKSTGPRTAAGKAVSSRNGLKHGLFSRSLSESGRLLGEDPAELDTLLGDLLERYQPRGREEELMVDCMATVWWRRMRLITHAQAELSDCLGKGHVSLYALKATEFIGTQEARLERSLQRLHKDLTFLQRMRLGHEPRWGADDDELARAAVASRLAEPPSQAEPPSAAAADEAQPPQAQAAAAEAADSQAAAEATSGEHASPACGTKDVDDGVGDEGAEVEDAAVEVASAALEGAASDGAPPDESAA